ncbi:immunity 49 family protein [Shewanella sp. C32]|uniref:Immunity 49 family protein n=1 Tax=Shewanella electrica TaxID=515560 RepID=A0ABT2FF59_9GAMM|nr:immunity 49 family protein [Shewanella electrica]MCH1925091.1 immunity 49 family protein [Shewanella electrica]MCS4554915.1 immunity 49 family protein [Shewanella electrica]
MSKIKNLLSKIFKRKPNETATPHQTSATQASEAGIDSPKTSIANDRHIELPQGSRAVTDKIDSYNDLFVRTINPSFKDGNPALGSHFKSTFDTFCVAAAAGWYPKQKVQHYLCLAKDIGIARFKQRLVEPDRPFLTPLDGDLVELCGSETCDYTDSNTWLNTYYCALLMRDIEAINSLAQVTPEIFAQATIPSDGFDLAFVALLKGIFQQDSDIVYLLRTALISEVDGTPEREKLANHLLEPLLPVIRCIFTPDADAEFNEKMQEAVQMHKQYWKDDKSAPEGWIALPLTALAALAKARNGWQLDFETDYIPQWLVDGDFS